MKLLEVLQGLDYEVLKGNTDTEIREIQNDSRKVQPGDLFFCISGAVSDGHTYAGCGCEGCSRDRRGKTGKCARHRDGDPCEEYPVCDG